MTSEEKSECIDKFSHNEALTDINTSKKQVAEAACDHEQKDNVAAGEEALLVNQNCLESKQVKGLVFFYLLVPIILVAFFFAGEVWFLFYPSNRNILETAETLNCIYYPFHCFLAAIVIISPFYFLLLLWRSFYRMPLSKINRIISGIIILCIWVYVYIFFFIGKYQFELFLSLLLKNADFSMISCTILFFLAIMFKISYIILSYAKSKHSVKFDIILCSALFIVYFLVCNFFFREGGIIYVVPFKEKYTVSEDFPINKRAILKSFFKFAELNDYKTEDFFHPQKQISYENLLTLATISPKLLSYSEFMYYPKFYVHYLTKEILYPLSDDLAQKEYWGRKLIVSSERIENHFNRRGTAMKRDIFLASKYLSILQAKANGEPEAAYKQWIHEKSPVPSPLIYESGRKIQLPQMTPEEEEEWLYWYKILWPQIEQIINPNINN